MKIHRKWLVLVLLLATLTLLVSCGGKVIFSELSDTSDADAFCRTLIDHVIADEKSEAYDMLDHIGSRADFDKLWDYFRSSADGARTAEIHTTDFWFITENGKDYFKSQYFVQFDNGSDMNLSLTFEGGETVCALNYMDVTGFYPPTQKAVGVWKVVLGVYSLLTLAFSVWMIVDCIRRSVRKKALWILLIIAGVALTLRVGEHNKVSVMIGLFFQTSSAWVDFGYLAVGAKVILPVGAIIYFFLRKRITVAPPVTPPPADTPTYTLSDVPPSPPPANEVPPTEVPAPDDEADTNDPESDESK